MSKTMELYKEYYENDDERALGKLLTHYRNWGYWFFRYNFGLNYDETDDIIQKTFISVIGNRQYNPVGNAALDTYFQLCAVRRAIDYLRCIDRFVDDNDKLIEIIEDPTPPPDFSEIDKELLWRAIDLVNFAGNTKLILVDKYIHDLSTKELAEKYNLTKRSVHQRLYEAKESVRAFTYVMHLLRKARGK